MGYRLSRGMKKNRKVFIIGLVLWAILTIILVLPFTYSCGIANQGEGFDFTVFIDTFANSIIKPFTEIGYIFSN